VKPGVSAVREGATKGHLVHLPGAVAPLAQTAMEAAVPSDAVAVGVDLEAFPAVIRQEVFPVVTPLGAPLVVIPPEAFPAVVSQGAMVGVAEAVDQSK
jgi:hypothetical protein